MKKLLLAVFSVIVLVGCSSKASENSLSVVASSIPHAQILEHIKPVLKEKHDLDLDIKVVDDYYIPNKVVDSGEADANFFQHVPFFENQLAEHNYDLANIASIHLEPIGIYSNTFKNKDEIKDGASIILSNSVADHGRILAILEKNGLIKLNPKVNKEEATIKDIIENKKNLVFKADVDPAFTAKTLQNNEADLVAINSNYALEAGLNPLKDSIILEDTDNNPYANIVVVKKGNENNENIKYLIEALKSKEVADYLIETYGGAVIPVS